MINVPINVRQLLSKDSCRKNFRVRFTGGEHADLTNDNIPSETVSLTESVCSGSIKFGMCESSVLSFDCDLSENLKGCEISAQMEIDISDESTSFINQYGQRSLDVDFPFYAIPYGRFTISDCKKNKNGLRSVSAYAELIGDDQVNADGTTENETFGLSRYEIAQMNRETTSSSDYTIDVMCFIIGNSDFYDPDSLSLEPCRLLDSHGVSYHTISTKVTYNDNTTSTLSLQYSVLSHGAGGGNLGQGGIYYVVPNHDNEVGLVGLNEKITTLLRSNNSNIKSAEITQSGYDSLKLLYVSTPCGSEVINNSVYIYSHGYTGSDNDGAYFPKSISISGYTGSINLNDVYELYSSTLSDYPHITISFPRTVSRKSGSTKYYNLDYKSLFRDGITITTKDKRGNETSTVYKFSYRDMVESFAELQAAFGMYWRKNGGFGIRGLNYPSNKNVGSYVVGTDAIQDGSSHLIPMSQISELMFDDELTKPYGKVTCTCCPSDATEEMNLVINMIENIDKVPTDTYLTYDLSSNYYIKTFPQTQASIESYMQVIATALTGMRFKPCEITCNGIPFIETGDWVEFDTVDGKMLTNVLRQTIRGVQHIETTIESEV